MLKSQCEEVYAKLEPEILKSLTKTRTADNLNQYLFLDYQYFKGLMIDEKISNKHFSVPDSALSARAPVHPVDGVRKICLFRCSCYRRSR